MRTLLVLVYYVLALVGCSGYTAVTEVRSDTNGAVFHGRVTEKGELARFECIESDNGPCHFVLYPPRCSELDLRDKPCALPVMQRVDVPKGDSLELAALPRKFRACMSAQASGSCDR